jgi:trehalose synthase
MAALEKVPITAVSPERFRPILGNEYAVVEEAIHRAQEVLAGRVVWHINSTAKGGGVAEMLHSLLGYGRGAGVDLRWLKIGGTPEFFEVTKRLHNRLHEAPGDGGPLDKAEHKIYQQALEAAADELTQLVNKGDIVYIHDPQPAGLIPYISTSDVRIIWRCHIGIDQPGELAHGAWNFLRPYVVDADVYIFSRE